MDNIIKAIVSNNISIFGNNPIIEKINIGFTNTIYSVNKKFIIKICTDINNEDSFKKEINFYNSNKNNNLIPKLYYSSIDKLDVPYFYEIIEKIKGVSLYNVWHTYSEEQREDIIRQLCDAMKEMHSIKGEPYNWPDYMKNRFIPLYDKTKELGLFDESEQELINKAFLYFDKYLDSNEFVLVHNDLHFDNIFVYDGTIKIIDFERSIYAPRDFELDIIYRMIRKPWKFASEDTEPFTKLDDYKMIMSYIEKYYPEIINTPDLYKRLGIYAMVYFMNQLVEYPHLNELKEDVLAAAKQVLQ